MRIDDDERIYLWFSPPDSSPAVFPVDPTSGSAVLEVLDAAGAPTPGSPYAMVWDGSAVQVGNVWRVNARTQAMFCGRSLAPSGSDVQLSTTPARFVGQVLVTLPDGQRVAGPEEPIDIA